MRKKILVIVYNISRAQEHEWFVRYIDRNIFEIEFALVNGRNSHMHEFLKKENIPTYVFNYSGKKHLLRLFYQLYRLMLRQEYNIVHAHLFEAALAGMSAAYFARISGRIVTRHYSDFHHVYNPSAVKADRLINSFATAVVAISENVRNIMIDKEHVKEKKIFMIHHGIDFNDYQPGAVSDPRIATLRLKYQLTAEYPVVGVISKFIEWKGIQFIIPTFKRLLDTHPNAVLILANAHGPYKKEIINLLSDINNKNYRLIEFENDVPALYKLFDVFVHVPITATIEAFGQVYIEALASKIPSIVTLSGIAPEFIVDNKNAYVVDFKNKDTIFDKIMFILQNSESVKAITATGYDSVFELFDVKIKYQKLTELYNRY